MVSRKPTLPLQIIINAVPELKDQVVYNDENGVYSMWYKIYHKLFQFIFSQRNAKLRVVKYAQKKNENMHTKCIVKIYIFIDNKLINYYFNVK